MTKEESFAAVDEVMDTILEVDGIEDLGIMSSENTMLFLSGLSSGRYGSKSLAQ
jgi:hypothetical protein